MTPSFVCRMVEMMQKTFREYQTKENKKNVVIWEKTRNKHKEEQENRAFENICGIME